MSRKNRIAALLHEKLSPIHSEILDESSRHHVPEGAETHFKVIAVSDQFESLTVLARHRLVNQILQNEFKTGMHALSIFTYTPIEWEKKHGSVPSSPVCRDGFDKI